ncbi:MAG: cytochrome c oxidase assembly protein [Ornithinimicrobium sp.]
MSSVMERPHRPRDADGSAPTVPRPVSWLPVVAVLAVALVVALPAAALSGATTPLVLADAGPAVRWGQLLIGVVHNVAAAVTIGLLLIGGFFTPESRTSRRREVAARSAAITAAVWVVSALAQLLVGFSEVSAIPLGGDRYWDALFTNLLGIELLRLWSIELVMAFGVAVVAAFVRTRGGLAWATVLAFASLIPIAYTGHSSGNEGHETAVTALAIHLVAISAWVGGLIGLVMLHRELGSALTAVVQRFSTMALWCYIAVGLSGVLFAVQSVEGLGDLVSTYWLLIWGKLAVLTVLGFFGYVHRQRLVAGGLDRNGAFARFAIVETLVMSVALGLSVALSRTPPPELREIDSTSTVQLLTGYPEPPPLTAATLVTQWEINWMMLTMAAVAVGLYVSGVVRLHGRGDRWPIGRTMAWVLGWTIFVYATSGAPGVYGRVMFSMHMVMHMAVMMAIPIFLVLGAPITLALRSLVARRDKTLGPREVLLAVTHSRYAAVMANPVVAAVIFFGSLVGFYWTGAFEFALTTHTGHVLMIMHFLLAGYLFVWSLIGIDPGPPKWSAPLRMLVLLATLAAHAFFGLALMTGTWLLAPGFFKELGLSWGPDLLDDQQLGGGIAWGIGEMPTLALAMLVTLDWLRRDERDARRSDRQADRDEDAELTAYNERLAAMGHRPTSTPQPATKD